MRAQRAGSVLRRGFSLVEMLVVVLIIGLMTGVAVLSLSLTDTHPARTAAEQLAELIRTASEEAGMQGQNLALGFWQRGWRFYVLRGGASWLPLEGDALLRPRELPDGLRISLDLQGQTVRLEDRDQTKPQVFLLASGEMQPFELEIRDGGHAPVRLRGNALGEVTLQGMGVERVR